MEYTIKLDKSEQQLMIINFVTNFTVENQRKIFSIDKFLFCFSFSKCLCSRFGHATKTDLSFKLACVVEVASFGSLHKVKSPIF